MIRSLAVASDLMVMEGAAQIEDLGTHKIIRTPAEPTFWFGNFVLFDDCPDDPAPQVAAFDAAFPKARHKVIMWDDPHMTEGKGHAALQELGFEIERCDVLTLTHPFVPNALPDGLILRRITTPEEWAQVIALQTATGLEEGHDPASHPPYVAARFDTIRAQEDTTQSAWFGVFDGDLLVADMGIMVDARVARYRSVETRASHRGKGICPALVVAVGEWALSHHSKATPVIVAEADSTAGRIYRRCGFAQTETTLSAVVKGY